MARKMKDSGIEWIGEIPEDWELIKAKNKYKFITGFTPDTSNSEYYDHYNGYEWVNISDLDGSKILLKETNKKISQSYVNLHNPRIVPKGSLMYSFKLSVGQRAFTNRDIYTNEAIASFVESKNICLGYLYYSSSLIEFNSNTNIYGAQILNQELIKNAPIPFPSLNEQRLIANFLDKKIEQVENIKSTIAQEIQTLVDYKKSVITEAVTKGLDKTVEMRDSGIEWIGEIPEDWKIVKMKHIANVTSSGLSLDMLLENGKFEVYDANNLVGYIDENPVKTDYISIIKDGTVGRTRLMPKNTDVIGTMNCITTNKINLYYLFYVLQVFDFKPYSTGSIIPHIYFKDYGNEYIPLPNAENLETTRLSLSGTQEQKDIVEYLDRKTGLIDEIITAKQKQLEILEEYKKSLIYEYVTGKKEV